MLSDLDYLETQHDDHLSVSRLFQETPCHPLDNPYRWRDIGEGPLNTKYGTLTVTEWVQRLRGRAPARRARPPLFTTLLDFLSVKAAAPGQGQGCRQMSPGIPKWDSTARRGQCPPTLTPLGVCRRPHFSKFPAAVWCPLLLGLFEDRQDRRDLTGGDPTAGRREPGRPVGPEMARPPLLGKRRRHRRRPRESDRGWAASLRLFLFLLLPEYLPGEVDISRGAPSAGRLTPTR